MHLSGVIVAALSALSFAPINAVPLDINAINPVDTDDIISGFSLQQQAHGKRLKNGPIALGNAYKKLGIDLPPQVAAAFAVATGDTVPELVNKRATTTAAKPKPTTTSTSTKTSSTSRTTTTTTTTTYASRSSSRVSSTSSTRLSTTSSSRLTSSSKSSSRPTTTSTSLKTSSTSTSLKTSSTSSTSSKKVGSAVATPVNQYDTAYMIPITLGGKAMMVDLDTGSSDLWAFSNLQSSTQTSGHNIYTVNSNNILRGSTWNVTYYDGSSASGLVYKDTVSLGGASFDGQIIEAAQTASDAFLQADYDGMLGLAFDVLNTVQPTRQKTLFNSISDQLQNKLFTSLLKPNKAGSYDFGYIDAKKYTGAITYANVDSSQGWWQFTTSGYSVGSGTAVSKSYAGVVDTGSTLMVLPPDVVANYYKQVSTAKYSSDYGAWIYPCSATLPNLSLIISGATVTVPGTVMTYGPIDYDGNCYGGLQQNDGLDVAIYGDIFIKSQFVVFDSGTTPPRVGFAKQAA